MNKPKKIDAKRKKKKKKKNKKIREDEETERKAVPPVPTMDTNARGNYFAAAPKG